MKKLCLALAFLCLLTSCDISYASPRSRSVEDTFTLLWYVNGSDLESGSAEDDEGGAFSDDLDEVLSALPPNEHFRVALFTGGARDWKTPGFSSEINQAHIIDKDGLTHGPALPDGSIAQPETLSNFIQWGIENLPAKRYGLIFWDHGSGVPIGFGYDELHEPRYMDLTAMSKGLEDGLKGQKLSFIGFDTCLMAAVETASVCARFTDTLVASEELEPFGGWDYAPLMRQLGSNPGTSVEEIGQTITDGYFEARDNAEEMLTLSVIDLTQIKPVVDAVSQLAEGIQNLLEEGGFATIAQARSRVKYYGGVNQSVDMVDLVHLASRLESTHPAEAEKLSAAVRNCVIYNRHTDDAPNSNGLSIYFPYENEGIYENYLELYLQLGFSKPYIQFVRAFSKELRGGVEPLYMSDIQTERLGTRYRAQLPPDILRVQGVMMREEEDGVFSLIGLCDGVEADGTAAAGVPPDTWLTINGAPAFAQFEDGDVLSVLAERNGEKVSILLEKQGDDITLLGSVPEARDGRVPLPTVYPIEEGDTVALLSPMIDPRRTGHEETFFSGEAFVVDQALEIEYAPVEGIYGFLMTDCYDNLLVTDALIPAR